MAVNPQATRCSSHSCENLMAQSYHSHTSQYYECCTAQTAAWSKPGDDDDHLDSRNRNEQMSALEVEVVERFLKPMVCPNFHNNDEDLLDCRPTLEVNISITSGVCYITKNSLQENAPGIPSKQKPQLEKRMGDTVSDEINNVYLSKESVLSRLSSKTNGIKGTELGKKCGDLSNKIIKKESYIVSTTSKEPPTTYHSDKIPFCNANNIFKLVTSKECKTDCVLSAIESKSSLRYKCDAGVNKLDTREYNDDATNPQNVSSYELPLQVAIGVHTTGGATSGRKKSPESRQRRGKVEGGDCCSAIEVEVIEQVLRPQPSRDKNIFKKLERRTNTSMLEICIPIDSGMNYNDESINNRMWHPEEVSTEEESLVSYSSKSQHSNLQNSKVIEEIGVTISSFQTNGKENGEQVWRQDSHTQFLVGDSGQLMERIEEMADENTRAELKFSEDCLQPAARQDSVERDDLENESKELMRIVLKNSPYLFVSTLSDEQLEITDESQPHKLSRISHANLRTNKPDSREYSRPCNLQNSRTFIYEFLPSRNELNRLPSATSQKSASSGRHWPASRASDFDDVSSTSSEGKPKKAVRWTVKEAVERPSPSVLHRFESKLRRAAGLGSTSS